MFDKKVLIKLLTESDHNYFQLAREYTLDAKTNEIIKSYKIYYMSDYLEISKAEYEAIVELMETR